MQNRFLKLSPGYFILWLALWLVISSKVYFLRGAAAGDFYLLMVFGGAMLMISYLGAWAIWILSGKEQRTGELAYLAVLTVIFLGRTILLYREAIAAG